MKCSFCGLENPSYAAICGCGRPLRKKGFEVPSLLAAGPPPEVTLASMRKDLRTWGIALVVMGVLSVVLARFLSPIWGVFLIVVGALAIWIRRREMFMVIAVTLWVAAVSNLFAGRLGPWTYFGVLQIYWGYQEYRRFWKYGKLKPAEDRPLDSPGDAVKPE